MGRLATISAMPSLVCRRLRVSSRATKRHLLRTVLARRGFDLGDVLLPALDGEEEAQLLHPETLRPTSRRLSRRTQPAAGG